MRVKGFDSTLKVYLRMHFKVFINKPEKHIENRSNRPQNALKTVKKDHILMLFYDVTMTPDFDFSGVVHSSKVYTDDLVQSQGSAGSTPPINYDFSNRLEKHLENSSNHPQNALKMVKIDHILML